MNNYKFKAENGEIVSFEDILTPTSKNNGSGSSEAGVLFGANFKFAVDGTINKAGTTTCNGLYNVKNESENKEISDILNKSADGALAKYDFFEFSDSENMLKKNIPNWCNYIKVFLIGGGGGGAPGDKNGPGAPNGSQQQGSGGGAGELVVAGLHVVGGSEFKYSIGARGEIPVNVNGIVVNLDGSTTSSLGGKTFFQYKDVTLTANGGAPGLPSIMSFIPLGGAGGGGGENAIDDPSFASGGNLERVNPYEEDSGYTLNDNPSVNDSTAKNGTGYLRREERYQGGEGDGTFGNGRATIKVAYVGAARPVIGGGRGINKSVNVPDIERNKDNEYGFYIGRTDSNALVSELLTNQPSTEKNMASSSKSTKSFVKGYGCGGNGQTYNDGDNDGQPTPGTPGCLCVFYFPGKPLKYPL
jgi:hypothetical protein